jgi:hypothetical protein
MTVTRTRRLPTATPTRRSSKGAYNCLGFDITSHFALDAVTGFQVISLFREKFFLGDKFAHFCLESGNSGFSGTTGEFLLHSFTAFAQLRLTVLAGYD